MVQHPISAEASARGTPTVCRSRTQTRRAVAGTLGRRRPAMARARSRFDSFADTLLEGLHDLGSRVFYRRLRLRCRSTRKILERRTPARTARQVGRRTGGADGLEPPRVLFGR